MQSRALFGIDKLNVARSTIPAVTHVDYSARIQTVHAETNPRYHALIVKFDELTGCRSAREHVIQRARRAHRLHTGRCLSLFHGYRDGCSGDRQRVMHKADQDPALKVDYKKKYELD